MGPKEDRLFKQDKDYKYFFGGGASRTGSDRAQSFSGRETNRLFTREEDRFIYSHFATGLGFNFDSRTVVAADFDRDGDPDLVVRNLQTQNLQVLRNDLHQSRGAMIIKLKQNGHNPNAIGARIQVTCGGNNQLRQITAGHSFLAQSPYEAHFGLGDCKGPVTASIRWPGGLGVSHGNLPIHSLVTIHRESGVTTQPLMRATPQLRTLKEEAMAIGFKQPRGQEAKLIVPRDQRRVVVNIWAPWCDACKREIPKLKIWASENKKTHRVLFVSFQMDELPVVEEAAKVLGIRPFIGNAEFFATYLPDNAVEIPVTLLLSHEGAPLKQFFGTNYDWNTLH